KRTGSDFFFSFVCCHRGANFCRTRLREAPVQSCRFAVGEFGREHSGTIEGPFAALCRESKVSSVYDVLIHARRLVD
ncbi:unnamed protein product, partial [Ectocarpus fasciculatus]